MTTRFDRSMELQHFLATATPEQVLERFERAEHEAFLWHVVSMHMEPGTRGAVEDLARTLLDGGYTRDAAAEAVGASAPAPTLIERLMAKVKGR